MNCFNFLYKPVNIYLYVCTNRSKVSHYLYDKYGILLSKNNIFHLDSTRIVIQKIDEIDKVKLYNLILKYNPTEVILLLKTENCEQLKPYIISIKKILNKNFTIKEITYE